MPDDRPDHPVQIDPIRARLGRPMEAREVRCPNCGASYATTHRWQMYCPVCRHTWIDRSSRTFIDRLRDMRLQVFASLFMAASIFIAVAGFGIFVVWLFAEAADLRGWDKVYGLAALFIASLISLLVLGRVFQK